MYGRGGGGGSLKVIVEETMFCVVGERERAGRCREIHTEEKQREGLVVALVAASNNAIPTKIQYQSKL